MSTEIYTVPILESDSSLELVVPAFNFPLFHGIPSRGITPFTCDLYRTYQGSSPLEVYHHYFLDGTLCGIKVRRGGWTAGKKTTRWEAGSKRSLFGSHLYEGETLDVYLFEGETDAMAMSQVTDGLCLAYGGKPSPSLLTQWIEFIGTAARGHQVHLCFDADEEGIAYTNNFLENWRGEGDLKALVLPSDTKDVAQLLLEGGTPTFRTLHYTLPECVLTGDELVSSVGFVGREYLTTGHTELDYYVGGYEPGGIVVLAGPTKQGKSAFTVDLIARFLANHSGKVLVIPLELNVDETMELIAAASLGKHITEVDPDELTRERRRLSDRILMVKHYGHMSIETLQLVLSCIPFTGVKLMVLDHITSAATSFHEGLTTALIDSMMSFIQSKLNEYRIPGLIITHTNATGGDILHPGAIRGSQSICQLASSLLGIRRLESGLSEVYTIAPVRYTGRMGRVTFEFNGSFNALSRRTSDL